MKKSFNVLFVGIIVLISVLILGGCASSRLGTHQKDKQYALLNSAIIHKENNVYFLLRQEKKTTDTQLLKAIRARINSEEADISTLKEQKENIFWGYVSHKGAPEEVRYSEMRARQRANILKSEGMTLQREGLVLRKVQGNLSSKDSLTSEEGLKVILDNEYFVPITFKIRPLDGGDETAYNLRPEKKLVIYLIPGRYSVSFWDGNELGHAVVMTVNGQVKIYQGQKCFAFAYMPRW